MKISGRLATSFSTKRNRASMSDGNQLNGTIPEINHTVLCVDDEVNILQTLKRLLRKENYQLLTAASGKEGLEILANNDVHLVISDQRMPEMSGTEFLAEIKDRFPDVIRIILTGYTEVDAITESINRGHIYKFFLKPWNDDNLKLEIRKALDQYDLIKANEHLTRTIIRQNEILKEMNDELEGKVEKRTRELVLRNQALELSQTILENIPFPILGISEENIIVLENRNAAHLVFKNNRKIVIGDNLSDYLDETVTENVRLAITENREEWIERYPLADKHYSLAISPLSGRYLGKGVIITFVPEGV
jgi:response regulator RpfG family c-di-GMP phosphodiesterase